MGRIKVLLADGNASLVSATGEYLSHQGDIAVCARITDGAEIYPAVVEENPDVVVMGLILPRADGFSVLGQLALLPEAVRPRVIVLTGLTRDEFILRALNLGASYYMAKPFDPRILLERIREAAQGREAGPEEPEIAPAAEAPDQRVTNLFLTMGIPAHIKGYQYLREAVRMVMEDHSLIDHITKELYPGVARRFSTSPSKVERAMRHAIEVAWNRGRLEAANRMYGMKLFDKQDRPSNGEFIATVADKVAMARIA